MKRESFGSRLGFILVSAGCAIGIGNVWKFPYICGAYGGAAFILIYLCFLVILGIPVLVAEFAVGRGSHTSVAKCFDKLAPAGSCWKPLKFIGIIGCYMLMMFYTTVGGWMIYYCVKSLRGDFVGATPEAVTQSFSDMLGNAPTMMLWMVIICLIGFAVCFMGLQNGIEKISKVMMSALLIIMVILAVHSVMMEGAGEGIRFYLIPDFQKIKEAGVGNVVFAALSQSFFTLSIGIGAMLIFGSYLDKSRSLTGEAVSITVLDTFVALTAGFIIIPACFSYGIQPDAGPSLIFNLIVFNMELFGWNRKKSVVVCAVLVVILSIPCVLGFNVLSGFQPFGDGSNIMDLEDFIVSNNLLPLGSLGYLLFCTRKNGWGWDNFIAEVNAGTGMKFPKCLKNYVAYGIPAIIIVIYLKGYYDKFAGLGTAALAGWMIVALVLLGFVFYCATAKKKVKQ